MQEVIDKVPPTVLQTTLGIVLTCGGPCGGLLNLPPLSLNLPPPYSLDLPPQEHKIDVFHNESGAHQDQILHTYRTM
jgi:hypothetical protein